MSISIVIPDYNNGDLIAKNLPLYLPILQAYAKKNNTTVQVVINDDGSTDGSWERLQKSLDKKIIGVEFTFLSNGRNIGFSTTVNRGVAAAKGEIVVLLNADVLPDKDFLEPLLIHFSDPQLFAVGCMDKSIEADGSTVLRGRGVGKWVRGFLLHSRGEPDDSLTLWVSGGSGAFRKKIWERLGGLNEMMNRFYWEDIDLSYRAQKAGYRVLFEPKSTVIHEHEEGSIKKNVKPLHVRITSYRNQFYFIWIDISDLSLIMSHLFWLPLQLFSALIHGDTAFLRGFIQALLHLPQVLYRRRRVQSFTKVSDHTILARFVN
ncbi:MAG TPA: glycosyltransferase family 2 protein [Patescibacteria group bacterium]|nr:glycosyltransferase family 2 protein [Patescibacteria group bacterium]